MSKKFNEPFEYFIIKMLKTSNKEKNRKSRQRKRDIIYGGVKTKVLVDLSKCHKLCLERSSNVFQVWKEKSST